MRQITRFICTGLLLLAFCLPSAWAASSDTKQPSTLVYGTIVESLGMLNPLLASSTVDANYTSIIFPSLLRISANNDLEPYFAERCEVSNVNKVLTYYLRKDAKWTDGKPVTARDVVFTFKTMAGKGYTGTAANEISLIEGVAEYRAGQTNKISGLSAKDDYTVELRFTKPYAPAYARLSTVGIVPEHIWKDLKVEEWGKQTSMLLNPVGFGPYLVEKYSQGQEVIFKANEDFFAGKPEIDRIIFKQVNMNTIMTEFKNGAIDIAPVSHLRSNEIEEMTKEMGLKQNRFMNDNYRYISFNSRKPMFQNVELRKAIMHAINRDVIVDKVFEKRARKVNSPIFINSWAYPTDVKSPYAYDLDKARAVLEAAGYKDKDNDGIRETPTGEKLSFTFKYQSGITPIEQMVLGIQHNLKSIGIDVQLIALPYEQLFNQAIYQHDFDIYTHDCVTRIDPDVTTWWHSKSVVDEAGKASWNFGGYRNAEVDSLLEQGNATLDQQARKNIYGKMTSILNQDVPMVFLFVQEDVMLSNPKLENYAPSTFNIFYNIHKWRLKK